jgi:hypothetical protein
LSIQNVSFSPEVVAAGQDVHVTVRLDPSKGGQNATVALLKKDSATQCEPAAALTDEAGVARFMCRFEGGWGVQNMGIQATRAGLYAPASVRFVQVAVIGAELKVISVNATPAIAVFGKPVNITVEVRAEDTGPGGATVFLAPATDTAAACTPASVVISPSVVVGDPGLAHFVCVFNTTGRAAVDVWATKQGFVDASQLNQSVVRVRCSFLFCFVGLLVCRLFCFYCFVFLLLSPYPPCTLTHP